MICMRHMKCLKFKYVVLLTARYSRRSDSKNPSFYKIVKNSAVEDFKSPNYSSTNNWELLCQSDYRFLMPGNVGPAWLDSYSLITPDVIASEEEKVPNLQEIVEKVKCNAQDCPLLLRHGVIEMFPASNVGSSQLTVVTLTQYSNSDMKECDADIESEREMLAKHFVLVSNEICLKLKILGYWADFINPFSGRPYISPLYNSRLYKTDERFRCLGFQIENKAHCKLISNDGCHHFVGSLFTTAPANISFLQEILK